MKQLSLIAALCLACLPLIAGGSVRVGKGVKFHALSATNATVTVCFRRGNLTLATNAVDCKQCLAKLERNP